jgi:hypothetical protein
MKSDIAEVVDKFKRRTPLLATFGMVALPFLLDWP